MNVTSVVEIPRNDSYNVSNGLDCGGEPHQYAIWERVIIVIVAVFLSLTTVVGNIMVMISFKIDKQLQTISNYFLFSLAVADFAIGLISMPLFTVYTVLGYWPLGPHVCDTWLALDYLASNASVLNLLIISFDRYFSVTRPLTYRAKRTTFKAAIMIGCAWGISLLLWPPWIYAWPYIEGQRTVPINACYIQFIETNHYITFGTAIAAFYVPVTVMIILYWRIWKETKKRQKDLPNLQAVKQDASKRSNSSDDALDMENCKRGRSESSTGVDGVHASHLAVSYMDKHYPHYEAKHRPFSWTWVKMWCIAWWHSGRDDEEEEEEIGGAESIRTVHGYEEALTPISVETPLTSVVSRSGSLSGLHPSGLHPSGLHPSGLHPGGLHTGGHNVEKPATHSFGQHDYGRSTRSGDLSTKSISSDSVYTILIRLPTARDDGLDCSRGVPNTVDGNLGGNLGGNFGGNLGGNLGGSGDNGGFLSNGDHGSGLRVDRYAADAPSIKMYHDDTIAFQFQQHCGILDAEHETAARFYHHLGGVGVIGSVTDPNITSPSSAMRRPSQIPDIRNPLNAKHMSKQFVSKAGGSATAAAMATTTLTTTTTGTTTTTTTTTAATSTVGASTAPSSATVANKIPNKKKKKFQEKKADRKAAKTLSAILLAFIITWTPYNILVLLKSITACKWYIPQELWDFFYYLCYINSTVNPVCYALCNATFRRTYVRILKCKWHSRNRTAVDRG